MSGVVSMATRFPPAAASDPREDLELVADYRSGDRGAAEVLVDRTYGAVYGSLFRLTGGDADLAADLTQEAYRKAWAALPRFDGRSRFSTWVYRIAYNTFLNHVQRPRPLTALDERQVESLVDPTPSPGAAAIRSAEAERLRRAVLGLPDELRLAVTAHYWGEMPVREIARLEGLTPMGVRKRLLRARRRIAARLEEPSS